MKILTTILLTAVLLIRAAWSYEKLDIMTDPHISSDIRSMKSPPSIQMYEYLMKYSKKYDVPFGIAYGIANAETGYTGAFDWDYNPKLTSSAGACGAMQILPSTASYILGRKVTSSELLNDLEFNVETSMKYMARLYKKSGRWDIALGYYNSGQSQVNGYAQRIMKNHNDKWKNL